MAGKCVPRLTEEPDACSGRGNGTFCIGPYALIARPPSCPAEAAQDQRAPYPHGRSWEACSPARRWRRYYAPFLRLNHTLLECPSGAVTSVQRPMTACHAMAVALAIFDRRATREDGHSTRQHCRMDRLRATACSKSHCCRQAHHLPQRPILRQRRHRRSCRQVDMPADVARSNTEQTIVPLEPP